MMERIIEETDLLFRKKGYHGTTMDDIARACNIKKPSLYYHIESREALLLHVVEKQQREFNQQVLQHAYENNASPKEKLMQLAQSLEKFFSDRHCICLISKLVFELGDTVPAVLTFASALLEDWSKAVNELLKESHSVSEINRLAVDFYAQIQGALLVSQINNNAETLQRTMKRLEKLLE